MMRGLVFGGLLAVGAAWPPEAGWAQGTPRGPKVNAEEYEGWRQYNTQCARCHGQDVLGNPVAADLLKSTAPGGPVADHDAFVEVVKVGRPSKGMPGLASILTDAQVDAIYTYVKGRAEGRIAAGRPQRPEG
jgi:mono/diheme cytochrome c family protein